MRVILSLSNEKMNEFKEKYFHDLDKSDQVKVANYCTNVLSEEFGGIDICNVLDLVMLYDRVDNWNPSVMRVIFNIINDLFLDIQSKRLLSKKQKWYCRCEISRSA